MAGGHSGQEILCDDEKPTRVLEWSRGTDGSPWRPGKLTRCVHVVLEMEGNISLLSTMSQVRPMGSFPKDYHV